MTPKTSIDHWVALLAVVDSGGYGQASEQLHRSQSAISYAIARLQSTLELPLLRLEGRKARLTEHGATLVRRMRSVIAELESIERLAGSLKQGWEPELKLAIDAAFPRDRWLNIFAELQRLCPDTQIQFSDVVLSGAEEAILDGSADVVVTTLVPPGFLGELLFNVDFLAVAHPHHALFALERELTAEDLERHLQVVVRDSGTRQPRDAGWLGAKRRCTVTSVESSLATVTAGLGYAWLPEHLVQEPIAQGQLKPLPLAFGARRALPLYLVLVRPDTAGPAARTAVESFQRHLPVSRQDRLAYTMKASTRGE